MVGANVKKRPRRTGVHISEGGCWKELLFEAINELLGLHKEDEVKNIRVLSRNAVFPNFFPGEELLK
jgi:hypothetical protein